MLVRVLGPGCAKCLALEQAALEAIDRLGLDVTVEKVTDYAAIAGYGVMATPALVIDEKVVSTGRVLSPTHIGELLEAAIVR